MRPVVLASQRLDALAAKEDDITSAATGAARYGPKTAFKARAASVLAGRHTAGERLPAVGDKLGYRALRRSGTWLE